MGRGQSSTEFLVLMAAALLILAVILSVSNDQGGVISARKSELSASLAVSDLANACREVYGQGSGARKMVSVTLPRSYDPNLSGVNSTYIRIHVGRSDYVQTFPFQVTGTLPEQPGTFELLVSNTAGVISVGQ